jgi:hypothetical protein
LPTEKSEIVITDFPTVKSLAEYIITVNDNDTLYREYMSYKLTGVTNKLLLDMVKNREYHGFGHMNGLTAAYVCPLCRELYQHKNKPYPTQTASLDSMNCPIPFKFNNDSQSAMFADPPEVHDGWIRYYLNRFYQADAFRYYYDLGVNFTYLDMFRYARHRFITENPEETWAVWPDNERWARDMTYSMCHIVEKELIN